jgi:prepilin-type N-terminal cleavage/methylation domain-containing protein
MKRRNGFTLVELLAVIVVLAIIMIIAIPAVLDVMNGARRKTFAMAVDKYVNAVTTQYVADSSYGLIPGAGLYVYDIQENLGYTSTGDNRGYVVVDAKDVNDVHYYVFLHDNNFMIYSYDVTRYKLPDQNNQNITAYSSNTWNGVAANAYYACQAVDATSQCVSPKGYIITG